MSSEVSFESLGSSDLFVDCVYKGGPSHLIGRQGEVLSKLVPGCSNSGGFRKVRCKSDRSKIAYVVLYTTMQELEWPDYLDCETGLFRYYGDNRKPGRLLTDTSLKGNLLLEQIFKQLHCQQYNQIPPFLIFRKGEVGKDVKFLGLAVPGAKFLSSDHDLVAFWRTTDGDRFQNYESYFTILDVECISRKWLESLLNGDSDADKLAPEVWLHFKKYGREGIKPLIAPKTTLIPTRYQQLQMNQEGRDCLGIIRDFYKNNPYGFEICATEIISKVDSNFVDFSLTRPWRDGGRDAIGHYAIGVKGPNPNPLLKIDCALEAKCYAQDHSVGVREISRLISRIRYRQFGILVTTSFVGDQAYREILEDGHPILVISAANIATTLAHNHLNSQELKSWLISLENKYPRLGR